MDVGEYEKQATDFLTRCGVTFHVEYLGARSMQWDEPGTVRDVYRCTFARDTGKPLIVPEFGQSLNNSTKVKNGRHVPVYPTAYDVLAAITKYDPGSFNDFCAEYGYDTDSRKAHATWEAVHEEWSGVRSFFPVEALEELREIN